MENMQLFIPITKVDAVQRLVYGVATAEVEDRSGEICDYESTKPLYEKWSDEIKRSSGGKSLGNLRAMHGPVAAGKIIAITFNDAAKQIEICAKVVDDAEWLKVEEGVYTGFSQGGRYVNRWKDGDLTRYTADPSEISLVDLPCLPGATFSMVKSDGAVEVREFKSPVPAAPQDDPSVKKQDAPNRASGLKQVWVPEDMDVGHVKKADALAALKKAEEDAEAAALAKHGEEAADAATGPLLERLAEIGKMLGLGKHEGPSPEPAPADPEPPARSKEKAAAAESLLKFCGEEVFDAAAAIGCLETLFMLLGSELAEDESNPDQQEAIREAISRLKDFVVSEIQEDSLGNSASTDGLEKRMSKAERRRLEDIKDNAEAICKCAGSMVEKDDMTMAAGESDDLAKARNHAKAIRDRASRISDHAEIMLSKCDMAADAGDLSKSLAENAALRKRIDDIGAVLGQIMDRIKKIEDEPLPLPLQHGRFRPVAKGEDSGVSETLEQQMAEMAKTEEGRMKLQLMVLKAAQADPKPLIR